MHLMPRQGFPVGVSQEPFETLVILRIIQPAAALYLRFFLRSLHRSFHETSSRHHALHGRAGGFCR